MKVGSGMKTQAREDGEEAGGSGSGERHSVSMSLAFSISLSVAKAPLFVLASGLTTNHKKMGFHVLAFFSYAAQDRPQGPSFSLNLSKMF
jgi:hypothetical protein